MLRSAKQGAGFPTKNILIFLDILAATQLTCFPSTWRDTFPANCKYAHCWWAAGETPTPRGNCHPRGTVSASPTQAVELGEGQAAPTHSCPLATLPFPRRAGSFCRSDPRKSELLHPRGWSAPQRDTTTCATGRETITS